jgi:tRNA (guanine10-N2)-dimethyltransferase
MQNLLLLSKEHTELAKEEILSLLKIKKFRLIDNLLIIQNNSKITIESRLGYTHSIYKFLFECKKKDLLKKIDLFNWPKIYKKSLCIRVHDTKEFNEKKIAFLIYQKIKNPKVNLDAPTTKIEFFIREDKVIVGLFISNIDKSYVERRAHLRPRLHPTSLYPGLARACINLTGLNEGLILDPFCGSGGILIEAAIMGFNIIGYDIDDDQIHRAIENLEFYHITNYKLENKDATLINIKADAIVTDLPYGKGSKAKNLVELYEKFLTTASSVTDNMIIIFPNFIDYRKIVLKSNWKIEKTFSVYIHKSLTRNILKLKVRPH